MSLKRHLNTYNADGAIGLDNNPSINSSLFLVDRANIIEQLNC